jgi:hypothetical protein
MGATHLGSPAADFMELAVEIEAQIGLPGNRHFRLWQSCSRTMVNNSTSSNQHGGVNHFVL